MIDFKLFGGLGDGQRDKQTDNGGCRVPLATEKLFF